MAVVGDRKKRRLWLLIIVAAVIIVAIYSYYVDTLQSEWAPKCFFWCWRGGNVRVVVLKGLFTNWLTWISQACGIRIPFCFGNTLYVAACLFELFRRRASFPSAECGCLQFTRSYGRVLHYNWLLGVAECVWFLNPNRSLTPNNELRISTTVQNPTS